MVSVFNFKDYRAFIRAQIREMPKAGYGQLRKLAQALSIHTTLVSQVIKGGRSFTLEQAADTAEFFSLNEMETDFFLLLVQFDRASSPALKRNLSRQMAALQGKSKELETRLKSERKLGEAERAVFYSGWAYSAVRQLTAIEGFQSIDTIAEHLGLPRKKAKTIIDFLLAAGLCKEEKGQLKIGPASTHLEVSSPWVKLVHTNWRHKAVETLEQESPAKIHYTAPMTLSKEDAEKMREMIIKFLESVDALVEPSPSEELHCLNIDWFEVSR